jgi:hypothetical protein
MMKLAINTKQFKKDMSNIVEYSFGYVDGVHAGKTVFFHNLGLSVSEMLEKYIDSNARVNPEALNHIYEWSQVGSPNARLYDLKYTVSNQGLSFITNFKQSKSIKEGSRVPFYDKAKIMENGVPVTIRPKKRVLAFTIDNEEIFTSNDVTVTNPGGTEVQGSFSKTIDEFMLFYFKQSFLRASGIYNYIQNPTVFKKDIKQGSRLGKNKGIQTGFRWIANLKIGVE